MQDGQVRIVVSGGTGVIGRAAVRSLLAAGHDVDVLSRSAENTAVIEGLGARPRPADLFDVDSLEAIYAGADAVVNLASHVPVGYAAMWPGAWRSNDALRTTAVANVVARGQGGRGPPRRPGERQLPVRRPRRHLDHRAGPDRDHAGDRAVGGRRVARAGLRVELPQRCGAALRCRSSATTTSTRFWLKAAANKRPVGVGRPDGWAHLVHTDDLGPAVVAALHAPKGVYNVGAAPVLRGELVAGYAKAVGADSGAFLGPVLRRLAGPRIEPMARSLRVSSDHFSAQTGWRPIRPTFDPAWFDAAELPATASR